MRDGRAANGRFSDGLAIGLAIALVVGALGLSEVRAQRDNVARALAKCGDVGAIAAPGWQEAGPHGRAGNRRPIFGNGGPLGVH